MTTIDRRADECHGYDLDGNPIIPIVLLQVEDDAAEEVSFGDFLRDNEFDPCELAEINAAMARDGLYVGGGGASPIWQISLPA